MTTYFISDLHLSPDHPETAQAFKIFLQTQAVQADAVYILGDLFEAWIGDDDLSPFNQEIIAQLRALADKNVALFFMRGNRDFLIGKRFAELSGCQILEDPTVIDLYGTKTLLMHGDLLCTDDIAYQNYRIKVNNPFYQKVFLILPLSMRKFIASHMRRLSMKRNLSHMPEIMDVNLKAVREALKQHKVKLLIHGHTHKPGIEYLRLKDEYGCRITLSDWDSSGNFLTYGFEGNFQLMYTPIPIRSK